MVCRRASPSSPPLNARLPTLFFTITRNSALFQIFQCAVFPSEGEGQRNLRTSMVLTNSPRAPKGAPRVGGVRAFQSIAQDEAKENIAREGDVSAKAAKPTAQNSKAGPTRSKLEKPWKVTSSNNKPTLTLPSREIQPQEM